MGKGGSRLHAVHGGNASFGKAFLPTTFSYTPSGHTVFFNQEFNTLAIDAERRNCYLKDGYLLPSDIILRHPDEALCKFLKINHLP